MLNRSQSSPSVLTLLLLATPILVGCAPDSPSGTTTAPPLTVSQPDPAPAATTNSPVATSSPSVHKTLDSATCLIGSWRADNQFFLQQMQEFGPGVGEVSGTVHLEFFADGVMTTTYSQWQIFGEIEDAEFLLRRSGQDRGTYEVDGSYLSFRDTEMGSQLTATLGGVGMEIPPVPVVYQDAEFTCEPDAATILTADGAVLLTRP